MLGGNHDPEIVNRPRQLVILAAEFERGEVTREWYEERMRTLTESIEDEYGDRQLHLTASYTLMAPLRFHLYKLARPDKARVHAALEGRPVDRFPVTALYSPFLSGGSLRRTDRAARRHSSLVAAGSTRGSCRRTGGHA